ncbi:MAG TPA: hypothetical protein VNJ01_10330 [Bacteriovoracaceae bacterium]|nr:hypothetical protein [Bacteriovoracaceae bacterium]
MIVKLILRNGLMGSFYVYGGQGGGKYHKPTAFELGAMMKVMVKDQKSHRVDTSELMISVEHQRMWAAENIRYDIHAYYLVCLYFEIVQKFSIPFEFGTSDYENADHAGVFSVLSNALFYLEDSLVKKKFQAPGHLTLFLIKLLYHLGIMPDTDTCSYCAGTLMESERVHFLPASGQFSCGQCTQGENERGFLLRIKKGYQTRYPDYLQLTGTSFTEADKLIQYFCHQYHLRPVELKTYSLLLK